MTSEVKFCQSCLERYGKSNVIASREWKANYFICEDCFEPLINNVYSDAGYMQPEKKVIESITIDSSKPVLNQFYDLLNVPEVIRFQTQDKLLQGRNDIYTHHAPSVQNLSLEEAVTKIEELKVIFSYCKEVASVHNDYIQLLKSKNREKYHESGIEKSTEEVGKIKKSKATLSQKEKLAKSLGITVEMLDAASSAAKQVQKTENVNQFNELIGKEVTTCNKAFFDENKKPSICKLKPGHEGSHSKAEVATV